MHSATHKSTSSGNICVARERDIHYFLSTPSLQKSRRWHARQARNPISCSSVIKPQTGIGTAPPAPISDPLKALFENKFEHRQDARIDIRGVCVNQLEWV